MTCDICTAADPENTMYTAGGHQLDLCAPCLDVLMEGREIIDKRGFVFKLKGHVLTVRHVNILRMQTEDYIKSVRAPIVRDPLRGVWKLEATPEEIKRVKELLAEADRPRSRWSQLLQQAIQDQDGLEPVIVRDPLGGM